MNDHIRDTQPAAGTPAGDRPSLAYTAAKTAALVAVFGIAAPALAADSGGEPMPWEGPMDRFLAFFTGPFVRIAAIIAIVLLGVGMAFSENGTGMRKMVTAFFGIALAFGAATWGLSFFGFTGGADVGGQYLPGDLDPPAAVDGDGAAPPDAAPQEPQGQGAQP